MGVFDLLLQSSTSVSLLGALLLLLLLFFVSSLSFGSEDRKCPPGPKPLPIVGNLLQLDLRRPYNSLLEVRGPLLLCSWARCQTLLLLTAFQEVWTGLHRPPGTQKGGGSGRVQDGEGGPGEPR